ncbi:hypothetical protein BV898_03686 [Hypsibius exemplaris]|uniref:Uncharacterized protein n=1 Tax=Hypsibius exemplaris TaxID=2072580 RepID=A0A1W0X5B9_HYPEX|nr:hypothetical protein BV898_03686 [Hypsibius exemplaris]
MALMFSEEPPVYSKKPNSSGGQASQVSPTYNSGGGSPVNAYGKMPMRIRHSRCRYPEITAKDVFKLYPTIRIYDPPWPNTEPPYNIRRKLDHGIHPYDPPCHVTTLT